MELKLFRNTVIRDLKRQFSKAFPYLKIEFFWHEHRPGEGSRLKQKIGDNVVLADIDSIKKEGSFSFGAEIPVADFEQRLQKEYGLPVQVFRKAGEIWIETIQTDNLSLAKQNSMGESASQRIRININSLFL
jgi:hypothetical protein